jgi:C4-dicarboxylate-specific signal transduction histidine kinase
MKFDIRTAYLIVAFLYMALPAVVWMVLSAHKKRAYFIWCSGSVLFGVGFILLGLRSIIHPYISYIVGNMFLVSGTLLHVKGMQAEFEGEWKTRWVALGITAYTLVYVLIHLYSPDDRSRAVYVYVLYFVLDALMLKMIYTMNQISQREKSVSARVVAISYVFVVLTLGFRQVLIVGGLTEYGEMAGGLDVAALSMSLVFMGIAEHTGYVGLALDRSATREVEFARKIAHDETTKAFKQQLSHMDRQRTLGIMAASLGHELSQPLSAISTNCATLQRGFELGKIDKGSAETILSQISVSVVRSKKIIDGIRNFIKPKTSSVVSLFVVDVVNSVLELMSNEINKQRIRVTLSPADTKAVVTADEVQLQQVLVNIIRNSIQAMAGVDRREIQISILEIQDRVILQVKDTGTGIKIDNLSLIGTPFFTTKSDSDGLGMGISISRSIIESFGGTLSISNGTTQVGAVVELNLPINKQPSDFGALS